MELTVFDRIMLLQVLPKEGDVTTLRLVRKLREDLSFSEEEHAALQFVQDGASLKWNADTAPVKDVEIGPKAHTLVADILTDLSKAKKLVAEMLPLYDRFVSDD